MAENLQKEQKKSSASAIPKPDPSKSAKEQNLDVLMAMNIYAESRGESDVGKSAVGQTVYNRANGVKSNGAKVKWWGEGIRGVITQNKQFSWLNDSVNANYKATMNPTETSAWEKCYQIGLETMNGGGSANISNGKYIADSYCANSPSWATADKFITQIGSHKFYTSEQLVSNGGSQAAQPTAGGTGSAAPAQAETGGINVSAAVSYNQKRGYSKDTWKKIQTVVGTAADGAPGKNTANAIAGWQKAHNLEVDGKCGPATYAAIISAANGQTAPSAPKQESKNDTPAPQTSQKTDSFDVDAAISYNKSQNYTSDTWKAIQTLVGTSADGDPGKNTANAIASWQKQNGLEADGKFGTSSAAKGGITLKKNKGNYGKYGNPDGIKYSSIVEAASSQIGFKEKNGDNKTPYSAWYGSDNGDPWCAKFVSWCANQVGVLNNKIPKYQSCIEGAKWFKSKGEYASKKNYTPAAGDVIFFKGNGNGTIEDTHHTGLVASATNSTLNSIEGNSSDAVKANTYEMSSVKVIGFGKTGLATGTENLDGVKFGKAGDKTR